jgi:hypothetical protein
MRRCPAEQHQLRAGAYIGHLIHAPQYALRLFRLKAGKLHLSGDFAADHRWEPEDHIQVIYAMKPSPAVSENRAAVLIWISAVVFTVGAMIFER